MTIKFLEYTQYEQLLTDKALLNGLIDCYQDVFLESWGEAYSKVEIDTRLQNELAGDACLRLARDDTCGRVVGFCWAQYLGSRGIKQAIDAIHYIHTLANFCIDDAVPEHNGAVYIHDIGLLKAYRGQVPLILLLAPVLEAVAVKANNRRLMFWSIQQTCIAHLAQKINIRPYYEKNGAQFYSGYLPPLYGASF